MNELFTGEIKKFKKLSTGSETVSFCSNNDKY